MPEVTFPIPPLPPHPPLAPAEDSPWLTIAVPNLPTPVSPVPEHSAEHSDPLWSADYSELDCMSLEGGDYAMLLGFPMPRGLPRPLWHGMPVAYTAQVIDAAPGARPNLRSVAPERIAECHREALCLHCGEALAAECVVLWHATAKASIVEGAMHHRCSRQATAHCPRLRQLVKAGEVSALQGLTAVYTTWRKRCLPLAEEANVRLPLPHPKPNGFVPLALPG